jgi:ribosomal protein L17
MLPSRGMGDIRPSKMPKAKTGRRKDGDKFTTFAEGGKVKSRVNEAGVYTKPSMRKRLFEQIKSSATQGTAAGQWSARKAQLLAKKYKEKGGGYRG